MHKETTILLSKNDTSKSCYVIGVYENKGLHKSAKKIDKELNNIISQSVKGFPAQNGEIKTITSAHQTVVLHGLGKKSGFKEEQFMDGLANTLKGLRDVRHKSVSILVDSVEHKEGVQLCATSASLGLHRFAKYKTKDQDKVKNIDTVELLVDNVRSKQKVFDETLIISQAVNKTKDLINTPPNIANPAYMASYAQKIAKANKLGYKVLEQKDFDKLGMGCITAVGSGSKTPPRMVFLTYNGGRKKDKPVVLVGKGITFDTGGYNLKPSAHIGDMKDDKGGSVTVLHVIEALATLKAKVNVVVIMALAENMVSHTAYRPDDILKAYNGLTVEIGNTDAEGRLVLADALSYAAAELKPKVMVNIATLTGASIIALGWFTISLMGNNQRVVDRLLKSGKNVHEKIWQLPLWDEYGEGLKSPVADLNNITDGVDAGCIIGGMFLKNFVGDTPWAHLDIGATVNTKKEKGMKQVGPTGVATRLLIDFVRNYR